MSGTHPASVPCVIARWTRDRSPRFCWHCLPDDYPGMTGGGDHHTETERDAAIEAHRQRVAGTTAGGSP